MLNTIYKYAEGYDINITFRRKGDKLVMILVPKLIVKDKDLAKDVEKLPPLTITETPQILEDNFEELIGAALKKISDIQNSIEAFDQAADKLSKKVAEKTEKKVEPSAPKAEPKKENGLFDKKVDKPAEVKKESAPVAEAATIEEDPEEDPEEIEEGEAIEPVAETVEDKAAAQKTMDNDDDW
jgi:PRTRC genetic system protein E